LAINSVSIANNRPRRKSPAATGSGLKRIFCWRSSEKLMRLVMLGKVAWSWFGKRVAAMVSAEREIVGAQVGEKEEGLVQIPREWVSAGWKDWGWRG
jgi:hypothetical protein